MRKRASTSLARLTARTALAAVVALASAAFTAAPSWAAPTPCTGPVGAVEIRNDVSAGPGCDLSGATVRGNVAVNPGGSLSTEAGSTTAIFGKVESTNATEIALEGATTVHGELRLAGTTERIDLIGGKTDNLIIEGGIPSLAIETESVDGNVQILNASGAGEVGLVGIRASNVGGNVEVDNNSLTGTLVNGVFLEELSVAGNLQVNNNSALGGMFNLVSVGHNAVGNNLVCEGNNPSPTGEANTARKKLGQCKNL